MYNISFRGDIITSRIFLFVQMKIMFIKDKQIISYEIRFEVSFILYYIIIIIFIFNNQ